jgi:hypothetical protein
MRFISVEIQDIYQCTEWKRESEKESVGITTLAPSCPTDFIDGHPASPNSRHTLVKAIVTRCVISRDQTLSPLLLYLCDKIQKTDTIKVFQ